MNPNVESWIHALRSGEFRQATGAMKRFVNSDGDVGYCCLGVAHCVVGDGVFTQDEDYSANAPRWGVELEDVMGDTFISMSYLPDDEAEALELTRGDEERLASFNDGHGLNFGSIANVIERAASRGISVEEAGRQLGYMD